MRFLIIDDDKNTLIMLREVIEDNRIGTVACEANNNDNINDTFLLIHRVDIIIMGTQLPSVKRLDVMKKLRGDTYESYCFIFMISDIECKNLISELYIHGVEYFITKPLNRLEVLAILKKCTEKFVLRQTLETIKNTIDLVIKPPPFQIQKAKDIDSVIKHLLNDLGVSGEVGYYDLKEVIKTIFFLDVEDKFEDEFPKLHSILHTYVLNKLGEKNNSANLKKEIKACEQRIRRTIQKSLHYIASIGVADYLHPIFEKYGVKFFNMNEIRQILKSDYDDANLDVSSFNIGIKKFVQVIYFEIKQLLEEQQTKLSGY
ncbi:transcriptional regulator [Paenibacillus chitinolyticus]|uniref:DNA-binding domain-containing protein n=1 Tax=Paenibacillus chitinolyticus TaxID=79263 RepID=UPI0026E4C5E3|nr:DNA-binding domain-containing protein [Paenibacillus chitinolyticus]GKS11329.1 transcriptional regulator [Paenibacillus chitinolyticus]